MPATRKRTSIDQLVRDAMAPAASRAGKMIAKHIAGMVAAQLEARLSKAVSSAPKAGRRSKVRGRRPASEISRWVTDRRARRVPNFVIALTGLNTKKKIVAKYGENVVFVKGKPAPEVAAPTKPVAETKAVVKAKPPLIRKAAAAAR